ncbi:MAG: type II toxin-antitoxin system PemK/MazF family toxin [Furfurilactobacillus sp.]|jgi:mRNA interferase MazF|uniref:Type II toxin-antitoxin system PemK/MazF family toxin n=2 Tax=Furfurilactobacillus TaxID=2767882 RepID=A0ABT6D6F5_9LACO|nr:MULTISPECIES: type II toxin-antitoxin system PemK/MazF family toxin [Furfurilactobacillus]QLE66306.1 PemK growth inhibitor [Furfurilactobacillus rossiae]MCF6159762.1 type II toxin-antitoxin system PemK/MazF family toxin [Furfurilactobacillus milii]MCF6163153.1 type II toxin-antitoxin system PemK/MazF family toxin [Furfurilactobacillus milii]MCF6419143.1 type II toxin-antitoxin system PemK/MazF family toxin [Furfurilactobacillus milii]MCH4010982.1 type II toxin-antitoxin system PemK/MazF fam
MNLNNYVPDRQDIIWINFSPSQGEEITKRRPAVVISSKGYTSITGLTLVVPITHGVDNRLKDFFIPIQTNVGIDGFINPLQLHTFSVKKRRAEFSGEIVSSFNYAFLQQRLKQLMYD